MRTAPELLSALRQQGVRLWADGERLRYDAPQGLLTPALMEELRRHKSALLQALRGLAETDVAPAAARQRIGPAPRGGPLPLSLAQRRLWLHEKLHAPSAVYNLPAAWQLSGALERGALVQSLSEIVRRHELLRTTFAEIDAQPVQIVHPPATVPVPVHDLRKLTDAERPGALRELLAGEIRRPFELARGPLLRALLVRLADDESVLLLTFHHIVTDGWSIGLFFRELAALYGAYAAGAPSPLAELPIQYADFAAWQERQVQGAELARLVSYWHRQLAAVPPLIELPTSRPRPAVQTFHGATATAAIDSHLTEQLRALGRKADATLFMTLLGAFKVLLFRISGQEDLLVASPSAGRTAQEAEPLIGFFVNTLVLRTRLCGALSFLEVLSQVRQTAIDAFAHQELPFERLVQDLLPRRELGHAPLAQVSFAAAAEPTPGLQLAGLRIRPIELELESVHWDLSLEIEQAPSGMKVGCEYRTDLFDSQTIHGLLRSYEALLAGIVAAPQRPIAELPLLPPTERRQILVAWNAHPRAAPEAACVHHLFEQQARRTPDATAVVFESQTLTYRELDQRADVLARHLRARGICRAGSAPLVGFCVERSLEMIIGLLGILKTGGAYVPLDPQLPQERLAYMIRDAQLTLVVTQEALRERLPDAIRAVCLDSGFAGLGDLSGAGADAPPYRVTPADLVYVIYTSGSTGRPKGVAIEHRQLTHYVHSIGTVLQLPRAARYAAASTLAADLGNTAIFGALCTGGTLVVLSYAQSMHPELLAEYLAPAPLDCLKITPSHLEALLSASRPERILPRQRLVLGGEALSHRLVERVYRLAPGCRIHNEYGPTETTVGVVVTDPLSAGPPAPRAASLPIGRPMANTQVYILSAQRQPVPIGVAGELYIAGEQVARGYLNRPELTAEKFVHLRFAEEGIDDRRAYRTGDLARYLPDGSIEFLGRIDHQIKIRGFRVELGEIESVLREQAGVGEAAVIVYNKENRAPQIVAYVTPRGGPLELARLRAELTRRLPEYMIPAAIIALEALPLNANGKLDRHALPAPEPAVPPESPEPGGAESAPLTDPTGRSLAEIEGIEKILATIWGGLLQRPAIGAHENLFQLGADSIMSIQAVARAHSANLHLPPSLIFQNPTIAQLARIATWRRAAQAEQGAVTGAVALTPIQELFFAADSPEPHHFNMSAMHVVGGDLDAPRLRTALRHLLVHHDALRLRFVKSADGWSQSCAPPPLPAEAGDDDPAFAIVDLGHLMGSAQAAALTERASALQARLELTRGPLLRMIYFTLGAGRPGRLLIVVHHLIIDGISWRILLEDLETAYGQLAQGAAVALPSKTTSFQHWAQWLRDHGARVTQAERAFWHALALTPAPELPGDLGPEPERADSHLTQLSIALTREQTEALLRSAPAAYQTQINDLLLTALAQTLAEWTGSPDCRFELEGHGREALSEELDPSRTIGWFTSVFPVHLVLRGDDPGSRIKSIKEQLRRIPNHGIGYGILRYLLKDPLLQQMPQSALCFNYLGQADSLTESAQGLIRAVAPESIGPLHSARMQPLHRIHVDGIVFDHQLRFDWIYSADSYARGTIARLAQTYRMHLVGLVEHCVTTAGGFTPSDFPDAGLSQSELDELVAELS